MHPTSKGYAFVLFESALSPHDWGCKDITQDTGCSKTIASIAELLQRYRPDVFIIEDVRERETRRSIRIKRIYGALSRAADGIHCEVVVVGRTKVRSTFAMVGAINKHDIAKTIASKIEAFAPYMPKKRKAWQTQGRSMALFDAASRALTYYYTVDQDSA